MIEAIKHGTDDVPQDFGTETEDGIPPMGEAKGRAAAEPALNQTPGDDKRGAVEISLPEPADKKQSEHKPEWDQQPPAPMEGDGSCCSSYNGQEAIDGRWGGVGHPVFRR